MDVAALLYAKQTLKKNFLKPKLRDKEKTLQLKIKTQELSQQVKNRYDFAVPEASVSCYCQCGAAPCKLETCPLCYNMTLPGSCPGPPASTSTTCCSLRLAITTPPYTAVQVFNLVAMIQKSWAFRSLGFCSVA